MTRLLYKIQMQSCRLSGRTGCHGSASAHFSACHQQLLTDLQSISLASQMALFDHALAAQDSGVSKRKRVEGGAASPSKCALIRCCTMRLSSIVTGMVQRSCQLSMQVHALAAL